MSGSTGFAEIAKPLAVANKTGKTYSRAEVAKVGVKTPISSSIEQY
jgi:hypothetical protein